MKYRTILFIALVLAPLLAFADVNVDKKHFSTSFAEGWEEISFGGNDSVMAVMNEDAGAFAWAHGLVGVQPGTAQIYVNTLTQLYTQGFSRTDSSQKNLGGKTFITTGWKDTADDSTSRVRIYVYQQGSFLFISWLVYNTPEGDGSVAEYEAALGRLQFKASSIFRQVAWNRKADAARPRLDVLGRTWKPASGHVPSMPYFLRR